LFVDDDKTNSESVDVDLSVDNIGHTRTSEVLAVLPNDSNGDIEIKVGTTEDSNMPTYVNDDIDLSLEYAASIEIRGPPANETVGIETISTPSNSEESSTNVWAFRALAGQNDLTLQLSVDDARVLELVDNSTSGAVLTRHSLVETSYVLIAGLDDVDDTLILDFNEGLSCNLDIEFNGGVGGFDSLLLAGNNSLTADYTAIGTDSGIIRLSDGSATATVSFTGLEPVTVSGLTDYTFTASGGADVITIDSSAAGQNRISGTSGGVSFESVTFYDVTNLTIDAGTNDLPGDDADSITIDSTGLIASGLQNFTIITGNGNDIANIVPSVNSVITFDDLDDFYSLGLTWCKSGMIAF